MSDHNPFGVQEIETCIRALQFMTVDFEVTNPEPVASARLVIAGGYDVRLAENREYLEELKDLAAGLRIQDNVS